MCITVVLFVLSTISSTFIFSYLFQISAEKINKIGGRNEISHSSFKIFQPQIYWKIYSHRLRYSSWIFSERTDNMSRIFATQMIVTAVLIFQNFLKVLLAPFQIFLGFDANLTHLLYSSKLILFWKISFPSV